jgi:hypothetical protein
MLNVKSRRCLIGFGRICSITLGHDATHNSVYFKSSPGLNICAPEMLFVGRPEGRDLGEVQARGGCLINDNSDADRLRSRCRVYLKTPSKKALQKSHSDGFLRSKKENEKLTFSSLLITRGVRARMKSSDRFDAQEDWMTRTS